MLTENKGYAEIAKEALEAWRQGTFQSQGSAARFYSKKYNYPNWQTIRKGMSKQHQMVNHKALKDEVERLGIPLDNVNHYWHKGKHFSIHVKGEVAKTYDEIRDELIQAMDEHSPKYLPIERKEIEDGHLLVIDPADIHIGKLATTFESGDDYNISIATNRVKEGVEGIINKSKGFNIEKIVLIIGNDILHIDTPKRTTTSGTPQDTDGMWYEGFLEAKKLYVEVIERLVTVADVHVIYNPSNHDYQSGFFLADVIKSWFRNCPNITFDTSISHRKYYQYGDNLIGSTHGDGAKMNDLPLLMAQESPNEWCNSKHRYVYTHHLHHYQAKDLIGVSVEVLRSPSGTDSWHHRNGYQHSPKAIMGFIHHKKFGQIARLNHYF
jgi:hypothetical protein